MRLAAGARAVVVGSHQYGIAVASTSAGPATARPGRGAGRTARRSRPLLRSEHTGATAGRRPLISSSGGMASVLAQSSRPVAAQDALPVAEQVIEVGAQVREVGDVGSESPGCPSLDAGLVGKSPTFGLAVVHSFRASSGPPSRYALCGQGAACHGVTCSVRCVSPSSMRYRCRPHGQDLRSIERPRGCCSGWHR